LAVRILSAKRPELRDKLREFARAQTERVMKDELK
jgi:phosphoribosylcarboxyaminoimidazole (NCAIR) mutase